MAAAVPISVAEATRRPVRDDDTYADSAAAPANVRNRKGGSVHAIEYTVSRGEDVAKSAAAHTPAESRPVVEAAAQPNRTTVVPNRRALRSLAVSMRLAPSVPAPAKISE
jgi:hypothetical protein